jgi:ribosome-binding ATPase YchF (GTP1/OBG family)
LQGQLDNGIPIISLKLSDEDQCRIKSFNLLTSKQVIFACNVSEFFETNGEIDYVNKVKSYVSKYGESNVCRICAQIESETSDLSISESSELLHEIGIADNGLSQLAQSTYSLLGLASFFTTGEDESRAWTFKIGMSAPQCAGIIHSDFEKGFIKAEVVDYDILMGFGSWNAAKEEGKIRLEGKDYKFKDGDVTVFRINR